MKILLIIGGEGEREREDSVHAQLTSYLSSVRSSGILSIDWLMNQMKWICQRKKRICEEGVCFSCFSQLE